MGAAPFMREEEPPVAWGAWMGAWRLVEPQLSSPSAQRMRFWASESSLGEARKLPARPCWSPPAWVPLAWTLERAPSTSPRARS